MKKIRFYTKEDGWSPWRNINKVKLSDEVSIVETRETMSLEELKKNPELYEQAKKVLGL